MDNEEKRPNPQPSGADGFRKRRHRGGKNHHHGNRNQNANAPDVSAGAKSGEPARLQNNPNGGQNQAQNGQNQRPSGEGKRRNRHRHHGGNGGQNGQNQPQNGQKQPVQNGKPSNNFNVEKKPQQQNGGNGNDTVKKDTYAYELDGSLYVNLTNKCSNGCLFCVRNEKSSYYGHYLWLKSEATTEKVLAAVKSFGDLKKYKELVFCGFGEPTYKMEEMKAVAEYAHENGLKTRLNTNGQGSLINKRDILPELKGVIDFISVSLNMPDAENYQKTCRSQFRQMAFDAVCEFGKNAKRLGFDCRFTVVDIIGEERVEECKKLCEKLGVPLYVRKYIADS